MSGEWEKYVPDAAASIDPAAFDRTIENHDGYVRQYRRDKATELARGVLVAVGPLIVEDTRVRLVAAAARAVERDQPACAYPHLVHGDGRGCETDDCPRHSGSEVSP